MADIILDNIYLILLLPLWIFLIIMCGRFFAVYVNKRIIYTLTLLSSFLGILLCSVSLVKVRDTVEQSFQFIKINNFSIPVGLHIDKFSLIMALVLFLVSFLVQIFSIPYMKKEEKNYRFYALLNLFNFSMAGLLFSPNLFQMYAFWELVGIVSYLLIGFEYKKKEKSEASRRVLITNRIGDTALLGGIILTSYFMYNYAGNLSFTALAFEDMNAVSTLLYAYTSTPQFWIICLLFITGAAVKSAQFPFYTWLQDAMKAKLPVSALLHSATMVAAGVYLIIRLLPFFSMEVGIMRIIAALGVVTALICSILASVEIHPKKVLAYSTSANLGLMFLAVGILNIKAALILFIAHAFIKSMLFLCLGVNKDGCESYMGFITFVLGGLSLAGLIFSGLSAKEFLFTAVKHEAAFVVLFALISFLTAFYIMRISLVMVEDSKLCNKIDFFRFLPAALLFILNVMFYFFVRRRISYELDIPFWSAFVGWAAVYFLYTKKWLTKVSETPKLLERFYNNILTKIYAKTADICNFIDVKILGNYKPVKVCARGGVLLVNLVETYIMNKAVTFTAKTVEKFSELDSKAQKRNVQVYNAYAFILAAIIISCVIITYTIVLSQLS